MLTDKQTLTEMIYNYALRAKVSGEFVGEFSWAATQYQGPEYEVTLLWTEHGAKHLAEWRVNLAARTLAPANIEAVSLLDRIGAGKSVAQALNTPHAAEALPVTQGSEPSGTGTPIPGVPANTQIGELGLDPNEPLFGGLLSDKPSATEGRGELEAREPRGPTSGAISIPCAAAIAEARSEMGDPESNLYYEARETFACCRGATPSDDYCRSLISNKSFPDCYERCPKHEPDSWRCIARCLNEHATAEHPDKGDTVEKSPADEDACHEQLREIATTLNQLEKYGRTAPAMQTQIADPKEKLSSSQAETATQIWLAGWLSIYDDFKHQAERGKSLCVDDDAAYEAIRKAEDGLDDFLRSIQRRN